MIWHCCGPNLWWAWFNIKNSGAQGRNALWKDWRGTCRSAESGNTYLHTLLSWSFKCIISSKFDCGDGSAKGSFFQKHIHCSYTDSRCSGNQTTDFQAGYLEKIHGDNRLWHVLGCREVLFAEKCPRRWLQRPRSLRSRICHWCKEPGFP